MRSLKKCSSNLKLIKIEKKINLKSFKKGITKIIVIFLNFSLISLNAFAAGENFPVGTRPASLANTYVMHSDIWSVYHNQAGLGFYKHFSLGFHHENKFVVPEYSLHALALTIPVKPGTLGISYSYFGYEKYNESKIGLGIGRSFGDKLAAGVQTNLHHIYLSNEFGNRNTITVEGGIQYKPDDKVSFGIHVFNPSRSRISAYNSDTLTTTFRAGTSYSPFKKLILGFEIEKHIDKQPIYKGGIEYQLFESLFLRTGIFTNPVQNTFGLGYKIKKISADIAFTHHQILGFTPHFSLQVEFN